MYFIALAADYDGTLARDGVVSAQTLDALRTLKNAGRRLLLVTGRELKDLRKLCPDLFLFDRIVAENGALIYDPSSNQEQLIAAPPSAEFVQALKARNVTPLSVGRAIVATWVPQQAAVLDAIQELQLELQIVFNKNAVMVLPTGVNKATGLMMALRELDISPHNVVAVGDAENDHAFLRACGCSAAVANALPTVKAEVDVVLTADHGAGVVDLVHRLICDDSRLASRTHGLPIGERRDGASVFIEPYEGSILIVGPSGCGKSRLTTALTERMAEKGFAFCVVDPEGDYRDLEHSVQIGNANTPPRVADALGLLHDADVNLVLHTQALTMRERWDLFCALISQIAHLRARTGRPHWLVIDEAHQVLPAARAEAWRQLAGDIPAAILVTAFPHLLAGEALKTVSTLLMVGGDAALLAEVARMLGVPVPLDCPERKPAEALYWRIKPNQPPVPLQPASPAQTHRRHAGKYAAGNVGKERSFYFRGPHKALNVSASNLYVFLDVAYGMDDATWEHHLRAGDYSAWFRNVIRDEGLAAEAASVEEDISLDTDESRRRIRHAVWARYAAPGWHS